MKIKARAVPNLEKMRFLAAPSGFSKDERLTLPRPLIKTV
jgi:hypothetical protein